MGDAELGSVAELPDSYARSDTAMAEKSKLKCELASYALDPNLRMLGVNENALAR